MHALAVMHRRTLCENVDSAKIRVPFYTTDIDILLMALMHPYTPSKQRMLFCVSCAMRICGFRSDQCVKYINSISVWHSNYSCSLVKLQLNP